MEPSLNDLVNWVVTTLKDAPIYSELFKAAQDIVSNPRLKVTELQNGVKDGLVKGGHEKKLCNVIYRLLRTSAPAPHPAIPAEHRKEPLTFLKKAQLSWEKRILKSVNSMCSELGMPLARKRPEKEQMVVLSKWTELGVDEPCDLSKFRPVYAPKDFLEVLITLKNPNMAGPEGLSFWEGWGLISVPLNVKNIHQLRLQYSDMSINQQQTGVDDAVDGIGEAFDITRVKLGKKVIGAKNSAAAQEFCRKGCPLTHRAEAWRCLLGVQVDELDRLYYEQLKQACLHHDLLVDNLVYKDVKLTAANDDQYFVFEDFIYQVLLPLLRDTRLLENFQTDSATPPRSYIRGKLGVEECGVWYPPSGLIPFHGFSMLMAPLCFMCDDPVDLYYVFRELYCRYFHRLHSISSHPQGMLSLCVLFEQLLQTTEPQLFFHLRSHGIQPLRVAFKWMFRAFSGFLRSEEVMLLWDRILAYESLEVLAVMSVGVFSFRKANLMQVSTSNAVEAVFADLTTLKVIPLIQLCLFAQ